MHVFFLWLAAGLACTCLDEMEERFANVNRAAESAMHRAGGDVISIQQLGTPCDCA